MKSLKTEDEGITCVNDKLFAHYSSYRYTIGR